MKLFTVDEYGKFVQFKEEYWKPRIIIEGKLSKITTHDAITYSQKAETHKMYILIYVMGYLLAKGGIIPYPEGCSDMDKILIS
jgi:hypothetical protein